MNQIISLERKLDQLIRDPLNPQRYNEIGINLWQLGDPELASMYLEKALQLCPGDKDIRYNYGLIFYLQCRWHEAALIFEEHLKNSTDDFEVMEKLGDSYYLIGDYKSAEEIYEKLSKKKGEA